MNGLRQIWASILLSLRGLPGRAGATLVVVLGVAAMVGVMISLLAISAGASRSAATRVSPNRVIVMSTGAPAEYAGALSPGDVAAIGQAPGLKRDAAGAAVLQASTVMPLELKEKATGAAANVTVRGTGTQGWQMNRGIRLVEGRMYHPGTYELIVGAAAKSQYANLDVGGIVNLRGSEWRIVGAFEDAGGMNEGMLIGDAETLRRAFNRDTYQSVIADLESPSSLRTFKDALAQNPSLRVTAQPYRAYLESQVKQLASVMSFVAYLIGGIMAVAATLGTFTIMLSVVEMRTREIAVLKAIGFGSVPVVASILVESLLLATLGGLIGAVAALLLFGGHAASRSGVTFRLYVGPELIVMGLAWALAIGLLGALAPSIRAARLPIARALKAT